MKTTLTIPLMFGLLAASGQAQQQKMRDAATHEQLSLALRRAEQLDPMRSMKPSGGGDPTLVNQPKDLIASSDFLSFNGNATLVPKRAILSIPKGVADRVKYVPGSKIQSWAEFYASNRGWITTVEVSRVQAEGNKALEEQVSTKISKSTNLVVATYQGGPISVLPLKVPAEGAENTATQTAKAK